MGRLHTYAMLENKAFYGNKYNVGLWNIPKCSINKQSHTIKNDACKDNDGTILTLPSQWLKYALKMDE